ncbi:hypothetical protein FGIG_10125 [Fasciola gigantica]|uniref:Uncharacterized protein n=1 Tax=Fasciola gigantica TaxID=46835 RepID=A0A504YJ64_FASGI|nr:hypothetical protein FGIG_10125 [Fasciola gigantica]
MFLEKCLLDDIYPITSFTMLKKERIVSNRENLRRQNLSQMDSIRSKLEN